MDRVLSENVFEFWLIQLGFRRVDFFKYMYIYDPFYQLYQILFLYFYLHNWLYLDFVVNKWKCDKRINHFQAHVSSQQNIFFWLSSNNALVTILRPLLFCLLIKIQVARSILQYPICADTLMVWVT